MVRKATRSIAVMAVACAALGLPATAWAALGDGLPMGPARLHLGVELDGRYDSMAGVGLYGGNSGGTIADPADGIGIVRGVIALEGKSDAFKLNLSGDVGWNQYASFFANTSALSFFSSNLKGALITNPEGRFGFDINEEFLRSDRTLNPVFGLGVISLTNLSRVRARFRPGGGAIEFGVGGEFGLGAYTPQIAASSGTNYNGCNGVASCDPGLAAAYNSMSFRGFVDAKWRFLPKTGLTFDGSFGGTFYSYGQGTASYQNVPNMNAMPYSAMLGFGTLLTTRFSFAIKGGYQGMTFTQNVQLNTGTPVGLAEIGFRFSDSGSVRAGFSRSMLPVGGIEHYYDDNRVYGELSLQPTSALLLYGLVSMDLLSYGTSARTDTAYGVTVRAEYAFLPWLKGIGAADLMGRSSAGFDSLASSQAESFNYTRADINLGVQLLF